MSDMGITEISNGANVFQSSSIVSAVEEATRYFFLRKRVWEVYAKERMSLAKIGDADCGSSP